MQITTPIVTAIVMLILITSQGSSCWADESSSSQSPPAGESKKDNSGADASKDVDKNKDAGEGKDGKSKKPADVSGGRFAGDPVYVHLTPIVLPILGNTGSEQLVTIQITVEVSDFDVADDMHTNMPRVMDALIRALYGGLDSGSLRNGRLVDATKIKNKAMAAVQSIEGANNIKDVLIVNMSQRLL